MKYIIVVDKQPRSNPSEERREIPFEIDELRKKGDIHDDFIIENGQAKVIRRIALSKYNVTSVLDNEIIEELGEARVPLFEGDNYIYVKGEYNNQMCAEYIVKSDFTDMYVTNLKMETAIEESVRQIRLFVGQTFATQEELIEERSERIQTATEISEKVEKKVDENTITGAYLILKINGDKSEAKLNADKVSITANDVLNLLANNEINLTSKKITLKSTNFNVDKDGNMSCSNASVSGKITATSGKVAGFDISNNTLKGQQVGICGVSGENYAIWAGGNDSTSAPFRVGHNGKVTCSDIDITGGKVELESNEANCNFTVEGDNSICDIMGSSIHIVENVSVNIPGQASIYVDNGEGGITLDKRTSGGTPIETRMLASGITTPKLTQTSLKSKKKNIKQLNVNATELIKNADICLYNLKGEKTGSKKHIGLVIGEGYNCPDEVVSEDRQGVEQYSMTSLAWKAIQELIKENENLKQRIEELEANK